MSAPMFPPAPVRLSITTGWPHASVSFLPPSRPNVSAIPPTGNGTTMRIGLSGYVGICADASVAIVNIVTPINITIILRIKCLLLSSDYPTSPRLGEHSAPSLSLGKRKRLVIAQRGEKQLRACAFQKHRIREHAPPRACAGCAVIETQHMASDRPQAHAARELRLCVRQQRLDHFRARALRRAEPGAIPIRFGKEIGMVVCHASQHYAVDFGELAGDCIVRGDAAVDHDGERWKVPLELVHERILQRRNLAILFRG